ncbi:hypothetical protein P3T20_004000 [Paraburkholderia sp. GAS206C]|uniref:CRISPR-associated protein Csx15 n=1 Tax=unclassified Paraburkholderia TaxID=2615204 RepID=UPI003D1C25A5
MSSYLINFSGHTLSAEALEIFRDSFEGIVEAHWPEFDFEQALDDQIRIVLDDLDVTLNGSVSITIIPPGQSTLAILLASFLHGMLGHFPKLCYLELSEDGLYLPKFEYSINTQAMRTSGRRFRTARPNKLS